MVQAGDRTAHGSPESPPGPHLQPAGPACAPAGLLRPVPLELAQRSLALTQQCGRGALISHDGTLLREQPRVSGSPVIDYPAEDISSRSKRPPKAKVPGEQKRGRMID